MHAVLLSSVCIAKAQQRKEEKDGLRMERVPQQARFPKHCLLFFLKRNCVTF